MERMSTLAKLHAYALEEVTHPFTVSATGNTIHVPIGQRGEHGAKAFVALQEVLKYLDDAESYGDLVDPIFIRDTIERELA